MSTSPAQQPQAWEQQHGETAKAYAAAREYFDLGAERSLAKVTTGSMRQRERWSSQFQWVARAAAFDKRRADELEAMRRAALAAEVDLWAQRAAEQRKEDWELAQGLRRLAKQMMEWPLSTVSEDVIGETQIKRVIVKPARWTLRTIAAFAEVSNKLGNLAVERPTERSEAHNSNVVIYLPDNERDGEQ